MRPNGEVLIASRLTVALLAGIWLATCTGCPPPPGPGPGNDNTGDNANDNAGDNDNQNDNAAGEVDLFVTSPLCTICHGGLLDSLGNDVSIDAHWKPALMANAAIEATSKRNTIFRLRTTNFIDEFILLTYLAEKSRRICK